MVEVFLFRFDGTKFGNEDESRKLNNCINPIFKLISYETNFIRTC